MLKILTHVNIRSFASKRIPSIKFLGPRSLLKTVTHQKVESPKSTQTVSRTLSNLSDLPAMRIPSVRGASLSQW